MATRKRDVVLSIAIVITLVGGLYYARLQSCFINDDEGSFLYQVWRMSSGESPYQDFLSSRDPLFLYTGAAWMTLWYPQVVPMRALAVVMTLATGVLIFALALHMTSAEGALLSMLAFFLHPQIVEYGRAFQPEPFFLFFAVLGLLALSYSLERDIKWLSAVAGVAFAIATLYKLLAVLSFLGVGLYIIVSMLRGHMSPRRAFSYALALAVPFTLVLGIVMGSFVLFIPGFYEGVVGVNLAQGDELALTAVIGKGLVFFLQYIVQFLPLLLVVAPAAVATWRGQERWFVAWQLPTALAFVLLSRSLFPRLLYYLIPSYVILFALSIEPLLRLEGRKYYSFLFFGLLVVPWLFSDAQLLSRSETATVEIADYIASVTEPSDYVISDYQEINFHAQRPSTYHGAEISGVIVEGETITAELLIEEMEAVNAKVLVMDVSPVTAHQLVLLRDFELLQRYLEAEFTLTRTFDREGQVLQVYERVAEAGSPSSLMEVRFNRSRLSYMTKITRLR